MTNDIEVRNNRDEQRFEVRLGDDVALAQYELQPGRIVFTHTEVPEHMEGRGIAGALAKSALEYARSEKLEVVPMCSFIASYIRRHPEYEDLVANDLGE